MVEGESQFVFACGVFEYLDEDLFWELVYGNKSVDTRPEPEEHSGEPRVQNRQLESLNVLTTKNAKITRLSTCFVLQVCEYVSENCQCLIAHLILSIVASMAVCSSFTVARVELNVASLDGLSMTASDVDAIV